MVRFRGPAFFWVRSESMRSILFPTGGPAHAGGLVSASFPPAAKPDRQPPACMDAGGQEQA
ncbi:hypothetical protein CAY53_10105 [Desulfobulbus oralis]|uniref:Uncharacterized protein n=1 Tax=Desulfobulbus oralis TaxID=1986146 RepID=A0A2L1GQ03_9BACT|nr:hypothetical protein CAY53_10105 [Desulfobulbus oralis]